VSCATSDSMRSGLRSNTTARIVRRLIWKSDPAMADDYFETGLAVALFLYLAAMIIIQSLL
jgi:hypothetical protein